MIKVLYGLFLVLFFSFMSYGQTPQPAATPPVDIEEDANILKISTTLIQLDVVVTDNKGNPVADLKPEDFEVFENGKRQEITNFSYININPQNSSEEKIKTPAANNSIPLPPVKLKAEQVRRTYALVVDDLGLSFSSIYWVQQSIKKFINDQMQEGDLVAIIRTGSGVGALQSFTSDKRQLLAAVDKIKWNAQGRVGIDSFAPIRTSLKEELEGRQKVGGGSSKASAGTTEDYEFEREVDELRSESFAVGTIGSLRYIVRGMRELPGRKAMMLFSEGFMLTTDRYSNGQIGSRLRSTTQVGDRLRVLADLANRSSVVIYTIDPRGLDVPGMALAGDDILAGSSLANTQREARDQSFTESQQSLRYLAYETGGFPFVNQNNLNLGMKRVLADLSGYYLLGYQPSEETFDPKKNKYNNVKIKLKRPGLEARYRDGFLAVPDEKITSVAQTPRQKLISSLLSPFGASDINLNLYSIYRNDATRGDLVQALVYIDGKDLQFFEENGNRKANLDIVAMLYGDNGIEVNRLFKNYTIEASDKVYQNLVKKGFVYRLEMPLKKSGAYQFRIALLDTKSGKVGAVSQFIEIPKASKKMSLSQMILDNYTSEELQKIKSGSDESERGPLLDTALREFKAGTILRYDYEIYNPKRSQSLFTQIRLIHDGKVVYEDSLTPLKIDGRTDLSRIQNYGGISLGKNLKAGDYILQTIVADKAAEGKNALVSQIVQFQIIE